MMDALQLQIPPMWLPMAIMADVEKMTTMPEAMEAATKMTTTATATMTSTACEGK